MAGHMLILLRLGHRHLQEREACLEPAKTSCLVNSDHHCMPVALHVKQGITVCQLTPGIMQVTGVKVPLSLCKALELAPRLGAALQPEELGSFLRSLAHARLEKLRLAECCALLQVML